mgnify:CR=1 FL=1
MRIRYYCKFIGIIVSLIVVNVGSCFAEVAKTVYIYNDIGSSRDSIRHSLYTLTQIISSDYNIQTIDSAEIKRKEWVKDAALLAMPGGADIAYMEKLNGQGNNIIKEYVKNGGSYLGICAGAYYASGEVEFDKDGPLEVLGKRELAFFPGKTIGPTIA